jgi:hypothetical protein
MIFGKFEHGTPIVDPDTHQNFGAWHATDGKTKRASPPHLDHFHVEMKKRGNLGR